MKSTVIGILTLLLSQSAISAEKSPTVRKAEIIQHLIKSTTWPQDVTPENIIRLCVLEYPIPTPLSDLNNVKVNSYKIAVISLPDYTGQNNCQVLLIPPSYKNKAKDIISKYKNKPVLLLGEIDDFAKDGGSANFMMLNKTLALTLNLESLKESHLKIDLKAYGEITLFPEKNDLAR